MGQTDLKNLVYSYVCLGQPHIRSKLCYKVRSILKM